MSFKDISVECELFQTKLRKEYQIMADTFLTPKPVYKACENVFGRPLLDPCWHWKSHIRPYTCYALGQNYPKECDYQDAPIKLGNDGLDNWDLKNLDVIGYKHLPFNWVWENPPYSTPAEFLADLVYYPYPFIALIKSDTSTKWFHSLWEAWGVTMGFFKERLEYEDPTGVTDAGPAEFPSAMAVRGLDHTRIDLPIHWAGQYRTINKR